MIYKIYRLIYNYIYIHITYILIEGSLEVKLPTIWTDEKQRWEESEKRREEKKKEDQRRESLRRQKIQVREKVGKSRNSVFFQWFVAPEGWKVGSLKRRVRSQLARWEMKSCTPLWRKAHFQVKTHKAHHSRTTFGSWDVEKVHAVVARSTFRSENVQSTPCSDHLSKLRCRKSAHRCGAKHMSKSKCTKHASPGPLLEVEMSKKCTPLWREARSKVSKTWGFCSSFDYNHHNTTLHYAPPHYAPPHYNYNYDYDHDYDYDYDYVQLQLQLQVQYIALQYVTLHYTPLHPIPLHSTPRHSTTLHYTKHSYNYAKLH